MTEFITPVGRLVQGDCFKTNDRTKKGVVYGNWPDGSPKLKTFVAIAVEKDNPDLQPFKRKIFEAAQQAWPNGEFNNNDFSWKIIDGDDPKWAGKDGFAGCEIIKLSTLLNVKVFKTNQQTGMAEVVMNPEEVKRGYYVSISGNTKGNDNSEKPGMYMNLESIMLKAMGNIIEGGSDGSEFANGPSHMPAAAGHITNNGGGMNMNGGQQPPANNQQQAPANNQNGGGMNMGGGQQGNPNQPTNVQNEVVQGGLNHTQHGASNTTGTMTSPSNQNQGGGADYNFLKGK